MDAGAVGRVIGPGRGRYLLLAAVVFAVDQATKVWIANRPHLGREPIVVVPDFFEIVSWRNPGGLFSLLTDAPDPWRTLLFTALPVIAVAVILYLMRRAEPTEVPALAGFGLILGGALGNLTDRFFRGAVVDFLRFGIGSGPAAEWLQRTFGTSWWPAFNVADSVICVGAALVAVEVFRRKEPAGPERTGPAHPAGG